MLVNINGIYYAHVCEQTRWARSAGNSAIENLYIIIHRFYISLFSALELTQLCLSPPPPRPPPLHIHLLYSG